MRSYRELADRVFERRDNYLVARKRKRKRIIKRVSATSCALFVALGAGVLMRHIVNQDTAPSDSSTVYSQTNPHHDASNNSNPFIEVPTTTTTTQTQQNETTQITISRPTATSPVDNTTQNGDFNYIKNSDFRYYLGGEIKSWYVEGDIVHLATKDLYVALNTNTGERVRIIEFAPGTTVGKMTVKGDKIWISFPYENTIDVFDKQNLECVSIYRLEHKPDRFDVYGKYIFYTTYSSMSPSGSRVYRYDTQTGQTVALPEWSSDNAMYFNNPAILVNEQEGLVYVAESGSSGGIIHYYDAETLKMKNRYAMPGINSRPYIYLSNNSIYCGKYRLHATSSRLEHVYLADRIAGTLYAANGCVVNTRGVYNALTGEQLLSLDLDAASFWPVAMVTSSGNLVVVAHSSMSMTSYVAYIVKDAV